MAVEDQGTLVESVKVSDSDKASLASKIQSTFDSVMGSDDGVDETPEPTAETADDDAAGGKPSGQTPTDDESADPADEQTAEQTDPEEAAAPAPKPAAPTLPAAYVRSLKALEWTDEEIAEAAKNPSFITTAAKLHDTRNREISRWAEIGRQQKKQAEAEKPAAQQTTQATSLKPVDAAKLKEQYGDEALIDAIVGPVNSAIEQINAILPVVQTTQHRAQQAQAESLDREIQGFFGGKELEPYKEQYGTNPAALSPEQVAARQKVLELADALAGGAMHQGRQLSVGEALQLAHDAVSGGTKEQAARKQITSQLKTRQKGITLKPGSRATSNPATNRSDMEKRVNQGLASVFR